MFKLKRTQIFCDHCKKEIRGWGIHISRISSQLVESLEYVKDADFCGVICLSEYLNQSIMGEHERQRI